MEATMDPTKTPADTKWLQCRNVRGRRPALLSVSRQVRSEALSIYYDTPLGYYFIRSQCFFPFRADEATQRLLRSYLGAIGSHQAGMIKELKLFVDPFNYQT